MPVDTDFPYFWKERGDDESFERHARDHPAVSALVDLDGRVNAALYRIEWTDEVDGFLDALYEQDVMVEEATTNHGEEWSFRLRAFGQAELSAFQNSCYDNDVPLDIRRVIHNPDTGERDGALVDLTQKQRDALERGYFEVPREISATELGEEMDISRQAFSRRLHRAEQSVFANLLTT